jgi:hypothetical protein
LQVLENRLQLRRANTGPVLVAVQDAPDQPGVVGLDQREDIVERELEAPQLADRLRAPDLSRRVGAVAGVRVDRRRAQEPDLVVVS